MKRYRLSGRRGQVLVMVTFSLILLCGMLGLAVDLGWAYFVRKSAQSAADSAALAAVRKVFSGGTGNLTCGADVSCAPTPIPCPVSGNLQSACLYAAQNGYSNDARHTVKVQASDRLSAPTVAGCTPLVHYPPTAPCVDTFYWVTVTIEERVPQLFSAVLGNTEARVGVRATAAIAQTVAAGQLRLLNRENDPWALGEPGNNLYDNGGPTLNVPGGILLASAKYGTREDAAGFLSGNSMVESPFTNIRAGGNYVLQGDGQWIAPPTNAGDGPQFKDPFSDRGQQPPVLNGPHTPHPAPGGVIDTIVCPGGICQDGIYFATGPQPGCSQNCQIVATGEPLVVNANVNFTASSNFGTFVFFGGLNIRNNQVSFAPGQYILAGTKSPSNLTLNIENGALIQGGNGTDAGRIFILTDSNYPGLESYVGSVGAKAWPGPNNSLTFAMSSIKTGNNDNSRITLYGLTRQQGTLPAGMEPFVPVVIWQDQRNSYVTYNADSTVSQCPDLAHPCLNSTYPGLTSNSPELDLWATPYTSLNGAIYQPRGAWTLVQASGVVTGPLQLVTGSAKFQGSGNLTMQGVTDPIFTYSTALVE